MPRVMPKPEVLRWAWESINLSAKEVAEKMNQDIEVIEQWEQSERYPTYVQLEKLAHDLFNRPVAVFFSRCTRRRRNKCFF